MTQRPSGAAARRPAVRHVAPARFAELLTRRDVGALILGDNACAPELSLDAAALLGCLCEIELVWFWGRRSSFHHDRFSELAAIHRARDATAGPSKIRLQSQFDPIDFLDAADAIADIAAPLADPQSGDAAGLAPRAVYAVLDIEDPLDARLLDALGAVLDVRPLSTPGLPRPT